MKALRSAEKYSAPQEATVRPWVAVGLAGMLLFIGSANSNSFGVFFKPIAEEFGWSRGAVSVAIAIRFLAGAVLVMPLGYFSDRYGPRRVVLPCFLLVTVGFLLTSRVTEIWHLYLVQGLIMGAGTAGPFLCLVTMVAKWHDRRRGLALGIASAGTGLGGILFPPLAASLITTRGWQQASIVLGLLTLLITIPASNFVKDPSPKKDPSDETVNCRIEGNRQGGRSGPFDVMRSLPSLLRDRRFLSLSVYFLLFYISAHLLINHLVNYVTDAGIGILVAASMMSVVGIASLAGRLAMGPLSDRIGTRADGILSCSLVTVALVLLLTRAEPLMWVGAALFGVGFGGTAPLIPAITGDYLGTKSLTTLTGAILVGAHIGGGIGPWMGGVVFDLSGSYLWALILAGVLTTIGLLVALRLGSPIRKASWPMKREIGRASCRERV